MYMYIVFGALKYGYSGNRPHEARERIRRIDNFSMLVICLTIK